MNELPVTGYLRLSQIIGQAEVTPQQASENRRTKKGPTTPRRAIPPLIPVKATTWWNGVKSGRYPRPHKIGPRATAWKVEDIRKLIAEVAA